MTSCEACGRRGELWPTKPRVVCCGRPECRARLTWDAERWEGAYAMAESRIRLGEPLSALDIHARKVHRGVVEVTGAQLPGKVKKLTKKQEAKAKREARNPRML